MCGADLLGHTVYPISDAPISFQVAMESWQVDRILESFITRHAEKVTLQCQMAVVIHEDHNFDLLAGGGK
jgi:hypothetical protein